MPSTYNGIGTWYYGSKNLQVRQDHCEHCGTYTDLESYETSKFFVVFFIPVVPLGRYRIIDDCSSCRRHYAIRERTWQERINEAVAEAAAAFEGDRHDPAKALALLKTCRAYQDWASFERYADELERSLSSEPEALAVLGSAYQSFDEPEKAEATYRKSLRLNENSRIRSVLAALLIEQKRPQDAKDVLRSFLSPLHGQEAGAFYELVEAFQAGGLHTEAGRVLDELLGTFPELAKNEDYQRYRQRVSEHAGTSRPLASTFAKERRAAIDTGDLRNRAAHFVSATVLLVLAAFLGHLVFQKTQRANVYLVSGLNEPYSVQIGGNAYDLAPRTPLEIQVPRRAPLVVEASAPNLGWRESVELAFETGLWASLNDDRTYILNPDHLAVVMWEQTVYSASPVEGENPHRVYAGRPLYEFEGVDYFFRDFPDQIELSSSTATATRERLSLLDVEPLRAYGAAVEFVGIEDGLEFLTRWLRLYREDEDVLNAVASQATPQEFAELARSELEKRPLEIEWHRQYQTVMQRAGEQDALIAEYRALLESETDNPDLKYLLARILTDVDESERLLREAIEGTSPSAWALHGLGYQRLVEARFTEALDLANRAIEIAPDSPLFTYVESQALLGLGRFDALLERNEKALARDPLDGEAAARSVALYAASSDLVRAQKVMDEFVARAEEGGWTDLAEWKSYLQSVYFLGASNWPAFVKTAGELSAARYRYQGLLAGGDRDAAIETLESAGEQTAWDYLVVHLAAVKAGDRDAAERQLGTALELLADSTPEDQLLARCLTGEVPAETIVRLGLEPGEKAIAVAVLAKRTGNARLRRLFRDLNYELSFERYFLERVGI